MFEEPREDMVLTQIMSRGIVDPGIVSAMKAIPRHEFIEPSLWAQAYGDYPVSIGAGQTISQPYIVALMLSLVEPKKEKTLLEIGSGCGYLLAVASMLFSKVFGIERISELYQKSILAIQSLAIPNVTILCDDGYDGLTGKAPFDSIIVSCSCSAIPPPLIEQLAPNGILVAPVGDSFLQELLLLRKDSKGNVLVDRKGGVRFVPLISSKEPSQLNIHPEESSGG